MEYLALRTEELPQDLPQILNHVFNQTTEEVWTIMANSAWAIWRCRNEKTYGGQVPTFERFSKILNVVGMETRIAASAHKIISSVPSAQDFATPRYSCKVDGSWKPPWIGGIGFVVEEGAQLKGYRAAPCRVCSPMQAEAIALREAISFVKNLGLETCTFFTDNQELAKFCSSPHPPLEADWRAYQEINDIWKSLGENEFICRYIPRSQNCMADELAKKGSVMAEGFSGFTYPTFNFC